MHVSVFEEEQLYSQASDYALPLVCYEEHAYVDLVEAHRRELNDMSEQPVLRHYETIWLLRILIVLVHIEQQCGMLLVRVDCK